MKKFETGKRYQMRSVCDHECIWVYKVVGRTNNTVTLQQIGNDNKPRRLKLHYRINRGISELRGAESVFPLGRYSMCPVLSADNSINS